MSGEIQTWFHRSKTCLNLFTCLWGKRVNESFYFGHWPFWDWQQPWQFASINCESYRLIGWCSGSSTLCSSGCLSVLWLMSQTVLKTWPLNPCETHLNHLSLQAEDTGYCFGCTSAHCFSFRWWDFVNLFSQQICRAPEV